MIEGKVEIAGLTFQVQEGELMIYEPGGDGDSELIDFNLIERLTALTGLVSVHYEQLRGTQEVPNERQ